MENEIILGSFVVDKEDINLHDIGIVVYDSAVVGYPDALMVKRIKDGHLSNRKTGQLRLLTPIEFCKKWCEKQIQY